MTRTSTVTPDELYAFIVANAEEIGGQLVCRASLAKELVRRGIEPASKRQQLRIRLVRELEARGLVKRPHPRSRWLIITGEPASARAVSRARFIERMNDLEVEMLPPSFTADHQATSQRLRDLSDYMTTNVLAGKRFVCRSWDECESSISAKCTFTEGQLSHVGNHFDLVREGRPIRVVVVGQERGGQHASITLPERSTEVLGSGLSRRFIAEKGHKKRNPHMLGTTLALKTIFDLPQDTDHSSEFIDEGGKKIHIFDCFALVNRLLCAAHLGRTNGKPTSTMFKNCEDHFRATLEILEPTIVIIQGIKVWSWSQNVLPPVKKRGQNLFECELNGSPVMVATFTHPSSWGPDRWDSTSSQYFRRVVRPTLKRAVKTQNIRH